MYMYFDTELAGVTVILTQHLNCRCTIEVDMADKDELKNLTTNLWWVEGGANMGHGEMPGYSVMANNYKNTILYGRKWPVTICKVHDNAIANLIVESVNHEIMNRAKAQNGTLQVDTPAVVTTAEWLKDKL